jgi:hypothetical protein
MSEQEKHVMSIPAWPDSSYKTETGPVTIDFEWIGENAKCCIKAFEGLGEECIGIAVRFQDSEGIWRSGFATMQWSSLTLGSEIQISQDKKLIVATVDKSEEK